MSNTTFETSLALIQKDILYMKSGIDEVKNTLKEINDRFATKEEVESRIKQIEKDSLAEIGGLKAEIAELKGSSKFWKIVNPTLGAILGSILTFFIMSYFISLAK